MAKAPNTGEEMAEKVEVSYNVGGGFLGILTLIFITLKLTGYISWSWCWVLSPLWIPVVAFLGLLAVAGPLAFCALLLYARLQK
jgi:hypothetical protein